jgi:dienelactone hydrolase
MVRPRHQAVVVEDISIPVPGQAAVDAWLVRPADHAAPRTLAGVIYLHWLEPPASTQNRSEFLDEAVTVAEHGAVAILPNLTFPWTGTLSGDATDVAKVKAQEFAVKTAYQALLAQPGVDPRRTAVVGHDYGAMYGSLLAASEPNIRAEVYMSGDSTWSNWFFTYFLSLPDNALPAYNALFADLDPVDNVARMRSHLYLQWGGQDFFIDAPVRDAFSAADPQAKISLYADSDHFLDQTAKDDRIPWLLGQLGLR